MDLQLKGLRALVTGGSAGIGSAVVQTLAAEGCEVHFCARSAERIEAMQSRCHDLGARVQGRALDVQDTQAVDRWLTDLGHFDILVANVSAISRDWQESIALDIRATVSLCESALPILQQSRHGALTYIGSKAGSLAAPNGAAYGAAKAAMAHYMKSLSARALPQVRVNTVSPGDTLAPGGLWDRTRQDDPETFAKVLARNPMERLASADEVARVVAFISSPAASFVAGANWYVDGGSTQHAQF